MEETGTHREDHWHAAGHWQTLSHNVVSRTPPPRAEFELITLVTDYIGSCKFNYHTITTTMAPELIKIEN